VERCGFVAILGEPNVGKSTLLNRLVGAKISIVSSKVQTTRRRILGVVIKEKSQIIFVDTPGIFDPKKRFDKAMVKAAWSAAYDGDINLVVLDADKGISQKSQEILERLQESSKPVFLVVNKIDLVSREVCDGLIMSLTQKYKIQKTFKVSASLGTGLEEFLKELSQAVPKGPWLYPEDEITDLPLRIIAAEITREKVFEFLHQELPYDIAVETERWEEFENGSLKISQIIHVRRPGQKAIVLGKGGHQVKKIGELARKELSELMEKPVHLFLFVKVSENWMEDSSFYQREGLEFNP
jgi:GTP-binding protein Era